MRILRISRVLLLLLLFVVAVVIGLTVSKCKRYIRFYSFARMQMGFKHRLCLYCFIWSILSPSFLFLLLLWSTQVHMYSYVFCFILFLLIDSVQFRSVQLNLNLYLSLNFEFLLLSFVTFLRLNYWSGYIGKKRTHTQFEYRFDRLHII